MPSLDIKGIMYLLASTPSPSSQVGEPFTSTHKVAEVIVSLIGVNHLSGKSNFILISNK